MKSGLPVVQYLRMSMKTQEFSMENQREAIQQYADRYHFEIVKTYCDPGRTGVTLKHRPGLKSLLHDVLSGGASFKAILVYDVSRWGRFQDDNEAAHYEFLCKTSGVPVHYCAESFINDGGVASALVKSLKRVMAKEYSRELGVKVFAGQKRVAEMGFKIGGRPGFGLRRKLLTTDGQSLGILKNGERKSLTTDRVRLALGPTSEVRCVRSMFSMALQGMGCAAIAKELNRKRVKRENGANWNSEAVQKILTHPKYTGCAVWGQSCQKLHARPVPVSRDKWIVRPNSFPAIVDIRTFDQVQKCLQRYAADLHWSEEEILNKLRWLQARKGRLSESLIDHTPGMPKYCTVQNRFGTLRRAYELIGYTIDRNTLAGCRKKAQIRQLRDNLIQELRNLFVKATVSPLPGKLRPVLHLGNDTDVCIRVCVARQVGKTIGWEFQTKQEEKNFPVLLARANLKANGFHSLYVMPPRTWMSFYRFKGNPTWLQEGIKLKTLSELPDAVEHCIAKYPIGETKL